MRKMIDISHYSLLNDRDEIDSDHLHKCSKVQKSSTVCLIMNQVNAFALQYYMENNKNNTFWKELQFKHNDGKN